MSKINLIQARLRELDGGAFQKLSDAYLYRKGYERINPLGSVIAVNKVRTGTPDTLIVLPNGKYVLSEYTTQNVKVFAKLKGDIEKCLDPDETGFPPELIEEIVLCHTSLIGPSEELELKSLCKAKQIDLSLFGIGPISFDLYQKYPGLARDFLGVEVDTGQILGPEEFVAQYSKNALATPLDTEFRFRDAEIASALEHLESRDVVVITGRPGVGKSRLALEACDRFSKSHPGCLVHCIRDRGLDLYQDLLDHCSEDGLHLIFVDDANRVSRFDYALQLLHRPRDHYRIKIIATVRDYASAQILEDSRPFGGAAEVVLCGLSDEQLRAFVREGYGITNPFYLDRISEISRGNPRIAVMAALVALRENTLASLNDVSALYGEYFKSIPADLRDRNLLKAAGILAFFRVLDRSDEEFMGRVSGVFEITVEGFWEAIRRLHELEAVDLYEREVAKISDQVLSTYLFHLAAFEEGALDFTSLLRNFFPEFAHRLVDALNPVMSVFDNREVSGKLRPHVGAVWRAMEEAGDQVGLLHLMHHFWFLEETEILVHIGRLIGAMEPRSLRGPELLARPDPNIPSPSLLSILGSFASSSLDGIEAALWLLCDLLAKRPEEFPRIAYVIENRFGFRRTSGLSGYCVQKSVVDTIWSRCREGEDPISTALFASIARSFLRTHFHHTDSRESSSVTVYNFDLEFSPALVELRRVLWRGLFRLFQTPQHAELAIGFFADHHPFGDPASVAEIIASDAGEVLDFLERDLSPTSFRHCRVVQAYCKLLEWYGISSGSGTQARFRNAAYEMRGMLLDHWESNRGEGISYEEFESLKATRIADHFAGYTLNEYESFLIICEELKSDLEDDHERLQFAFAIVRVLQSFSHQNPKLYISVIKSYLANGKRLSLSGMDAFQLASRLVEVSGSAEARDILTLWDFPFRRSWDFGFFSAVEPADIEDGHPKELRQAFRDADAADYPRDLDFLVKYRQKDDRFIAGVARILLERARNEPMIGRALATLFRLGPGTNPLIDSLAVEDPQMLEELYLAVLNADPSVDYGGVYLGVLLDLDPRFITRYLDFTDTDFARFGLNSRHIDYSPIWLRCDHEVILRLAIDHLFGQKRLDYSLDSRLDHLFRLRGQADSIILEKQDQLISSFIEERSGDVRFMAFLFRAIASFSHERRKRHVAKFIERDQAPEAFENLPLEPNFGSYYGSMVPMLHSKIEYLESLVPLFKGPAFLLHRHRIERRIASIRAEIEVQKRADFYER